MAEQQIGSERVDYATGQPIGKIPQFCPQCATAVQPGAQFCAKCGTRIGILQAAPEGTSALAIFGLLVLIGGIALTIYYWQFFNVTVTTQPISFMGQSVGGGEHINNIGLMADRQNGMMVGFGLTILGVIMLVFDAVVRKK